MERRRYIRLSSIFPVSFQFSLPGRPTSRLYQGFTRNVSADGLCIELNDLDEHIIHNLQNSQLKLFLNIHMPLSAEPTRAQAAVVWTKIVHQVLPKQYLIGIQYENIEPQAKRHIFNYARRVRNIPRYVTACFLFLLSIATVLLICDYKIRYENKELIRETVYLSQRYSQLRQQLLLADQREKELKEKLRQSQNSSLNEQLTRVSAQKKLLATSLELLEKEGQKLKQLRLQNMLSWLETHQVRSTGLVISFEGDKGLENWAFTYDQSLSAQVFTLSGEYERARRIFDFYKFRAEKANGGFVNAYEVDNGRVREYAVHCGPNIWLAIAIVQYTHQTDDAQYLDLAESIADWVISIQNQDRDFGIKGGPGVSWFSTEHNLDAYALFNMLFNATGCQHYELAAQRTLNWLKMHAYNRFEPPLNRGRGDATIATDTFSWAICSLGPKALLEDGMDPEQILKYADENCAVMIRFRRPEGKIVQVRGFDFAKYTHMPRGGIVSTEWTAQMVVAYQVMADYFSRNNDPVKADFYSQKADFYLNELGKMIICSPSKTGQGQGCLPYASSAHADTGHGWRTPKGDRTGSLAATAYTIFASIGYNPLSFSQ